MALDTSVDMRADAMTPQDATAPSDTDNDGVPDEIDNCPEVANADQSDVDSDGLGDACDVDDTQDGCRAIVLLQARCAQGGCHLTNNPRTALQLTAAAIQGGSLHGYVVPGDPANSVLIQRMTGDSPGPLMPLGVADPIAEVAELEAWIEGGASTRCEEPLPEAVFDPNHQDADRLFQCEEGVPAGGSPRLRRVGQREWTRSVLKPLNGTWWGSTAKDNPLTMPKRHPYSTYTDGVSIDSATLGLYLLGLPEAPANWTANDTRSGNGFIAGERTASVYNNQAIRCIFRDEVPDAECIDTYVRLFLRDGVFFRGATDDEVDRLSQFLTDRLAMESGLSERRGTLQFVGEAAFLMVGALFRDEVGEPIPDEPGRFRLTADEMALAFGRTLSAHPVGATVPVSVAALPDEDPDSQTPELGRLGLIRRAAEEGRIFEADRLAELLELYQGGVMPTRYDLIPEVGDNRRVNRGEYWLAENIMQFFREWLGYDHVNETFKDTPGKTGPWDGEYNGDPANDPSTLGFRNLQTVRYGHESTLRDQLDDTIARVVVESHEAGVDVFSALMTTRLWRLPSNLVQTNDVPCETSADCERPFPKCTAIGLCGSSVSSSTTTSQRVYGLPTNVGTTSGERWVDMPEDVRMGVLTHPAWLAAHGGNFEDDASAVGRGRWIRERLFCQTVPGLDFVQVEAQLIPSAPHLSARERLRMSVEDPEENPESATCMGCHVLMNDLGYPFETFNHAGFPRAFDHGLEGSQPPSGRSDLAAPPDPGWPDRVESPMEFSRLIAESTVARRCFVRQAFRYFAGRDERLADACVLSRMDDVLRQQGSFFSMLHVLVSSPAFQHRIQPEGANHDQ